MRFLSFLVLIIAGCSPQTPSSTRQIPVAQEATPPWEDLPPIIKVGNNIRFKCEGLDTGGYKAYKILEIKGKWVHLEQNSSGDLEPEHGQIRDVGWFPVEKMSNIIMSSYQQADSAEYKQELAKDFKKAKIVFLRPSEESLITWDYNILINGKSVGKIEDEYIASYEIPAGENTITLSGALYEFPVLKIKGNSGSTHYISVGREGNGYTGYIGTLEPLETQEGERLCTMLRKENGDYEPLSKKRDNLNRASSSIIKRR